MVKTKIIATIGPASEDEKIIRGLVKAGVDIFRFNLKHNTLHWHDSRIKRVRQTGKAAIMVDLRGPEGRLKNSKTVFDDDLKAIGLAKNYQAEWIALSYVRHGQDIKNLKKVLLQLDIPAKIVAKIENDDGIGHFKSILGVSDAIMVARGDLGKELSIEEVPYWQKKIIKECRRARKPVIVATEMLESMIKKPEPTRAEISDIAQAVYDGVNALMLSGETAIGKYPVKAVEVMKKTIDFNQGRLK